MKTISIDHICRVEGNGGLIATIDGKVVTDVKFSIFEGPRLIERITIGRTPEEDVSMVPRVCAICTLSHKNAVLRAMENALSVKVSPKVNLIRELMHMGEMIESHSLHIFLLALPDYLGFPNAIAMASQYELEAKIGLEMKNFGNHIMKVTGGRFIHGENPVIGGFGRFPSQEELVFLKTRAIQFMPFIVKTVDLFCQIDYPDCPEDDTVYACCHPEDGFYGFAGEEIIVSTGDIIPKDEYESLTNEFVVPHSFAKHSRFKEAPYSVGALARVNNLGQKLKGESAKMFKKYFSERWKKNPLFHNAAQALEIMYCFERIPELVDEILKIPENPPVVPYTQKKGSGTGIVEAPRGLLIHSYEIEDGLVKASDIITPTAQNADDIERYCHIAAQKLLDEGKEDQIRDRMDLVVRAFDPCISCSVHMAEVKMAPQESWKPGLDELIRSHQPIFIGIGQEGFSDDQAGLMLARQLRSKGTKNVWLESEMEEQSGIWETRSNQPVVLLDAVDFKEKPGKITLVPFHLILNNITLSHRFRPLIPKGITVENLRHTFVLGIQPETVNEGSKISPPVRKAVSEIAKLIITSLGSKELH